MTDIQQLPEFDLFNHPTQASRDFTLDAILAEIERRKKEHFPVFQTMSDHQLFLCMIAFGKASIFGATAESVAKERILDFVVRRTVERG